jgi:hypothetical protein
LFLAWSGQIRWKTNRGDDNLGSLEIGDFYPNSSPVSFSEIFVEQPRRRNGSRRIVAIFVAAVVSVLAVAACSGGKRKHNFEKYSEKAN